MVEPFLRVSDLNVNYDSPNGPISAVQGVSFKLNKGETLGIAGESGCGKSTTGYAIINLLPKNGHVASGKVLYCGRDLLSFSPQAMQKIRWKEIAMVFQGAMNSLNPVKTVGSQIAEPIIFHNSTSKGEARKRAQELLELVGIDSKRFWGYPHEFSGGMKQRAVIAMALACNPHLLLADEPTTALDVMVQAQIMKLLSSLQKQLNLSLILITHDLALLAETCDRVVIMYAGNILELGNSTEIFLDPVHPYTRALIHSIPNIQGEKSIAQPIPGSPPNLNKEINGCPFAPRCSLVNDECRRQKPVLVRRKGRLVACHLV